MLSAIMESLADTIRNTGMMYFFRLSYMILLDMYNLKEKWLAKVLCDEYVPYDIPENPGFLPEDVSIIVPTIDTEDTFTECLRLWLANNPREIIVVTVPRDLTRVHQLIQPIQRPDFDKIHVYTVAQANKRAQLIRGIKASTGCILALVDDDTFWPHDQVMQYLLAPFEDEYRDVGAVGGPQMARLQEYRKHEDVITPWEVAALRAFDGQSGYNRTRTMADGGVWCLVGRTILVRSGILRTKDFYNEFANELWFWKYLNTGDDVFITKWVQHIERWDIAIQDRPEAAVTTTIKRDSGFARQMIRWQRSTLVMLINHLFCDPGFFKLRREYPYMAKKMVERLMRSLLNWTYYSSWVMVTWEAPFIGFLFLAWHLWQKYQSYKVFLDKFPFCRKNWWAAVLFDYSWIVLDPFTWCTIADDDWLTRNDARQRASVVAYYGRG